MTINSIDDALVTEAVVDFLATTADLSLDESSNVGNIRVGNGMAPSPASDDLAAEIDYVTGLMDPYLEVFQVPTGAAVGREQRSGYAGGTPSTRVIRYQIVGVAFEPMAAQRLAIYAAARICDVDANRAYASIPVSGHEIGRRERIGHGSPDSQGDLYQWVELIELDVALAP